MKKIIQSARRYFQCLFTRQSVPCTGHPVCKAIIKSRNELSITGKSFQNQYYLDLYKGSDKILSLRCGSLEEAQKWLQKVQQNPEDYFFNTKIIDQVIFSLPG